MKPGFIFIFFIAVTFLFVSVWSTLTSAPPGASTKSTATRASAGIPLPQIPTLHEAPTELSQAAVEPDPEEKANPTERAKRDEQENLIQYYSTLPERLHGH